MAGCGLLCISLESKENYIRLLVQAVSVNKLDSIQ